MRFISGAPSVACTLPFQFSYFSFLFLTSEGGTQREALIITSSLKNLIKDSRNKYHTRLRNQEVALVSRGFLENRKFASCMVSYLCDAWCQTCVMHGRNLCDAWCYTCVMHGLVGTCVMHGRYTCVMHGPSKVVNGMDNLLSKALNFLIAGMPAHGFLLLVYARLSSILTSFRNPGQDLDSSSSFSSRFFACALDRLTLGFLMTKSTFLSLVLQQKSSSPPCFLSHVSASRQAPLNTR